MIWRKSTLTGFAAAVAMIVAIVVATSTWHSNIGQGSGGVGRRRVCPISAAALPPPLWRSRWAKAYAHIAEHTSACCNVKSSRMARHHGPGHARC
jgi:hypothetical protein